MPSKLGLSVATPDALFDLSETALVVLGVLLPNPEIVAVSPQQAAVAKSLLDKAFEKFAVCFPAELSVIELQLKLSKKKQAFQRLHQ